MTFSGRLITSLQNLCPYISVYTDTRAKHSCLYTLIQNGHSFCKHYLLDLIKQTLLGGFLTLDTFDS